jgi:hypothetical protein
MARSSGEHGVAFFVEEKDIKIPTSRAAAAAAAAAAATAAAAAAG